ncbi:MAG: recombination mediator RecR [Patescibacteria group bacterium]|jgi:recombination protein RecR
MLPKSVQNLIDEFSKLPGVGPKTAARLAFYLLTKPKSDIENLGSSVLGLANNLQYCKECFNIAEEEICLICDNDRRNKNIIMVVEEPLDVIALEKSLPFEGVYHVLGGVVSPINGVGPDDLRIAQLIERIKNGAVEEIVLATNPNLEGEATAAYIKDRINQLNLDNLRITRIARGLPVGGDLEYADEVTLKRSIEGRRDY